MVPLHTNLLWQPQLIRTKTREEIKRREEPVGVEKPTGAHLHELCEYSKNVKI